jgi:hypothetical protein
MTGIAQLAKKEDLLVVELMVLPVQKIAAMISQILHPDRQEDAVRPAVRNLDLSVKTMMSFLQNMWNTNR